LAQPRPINREDVCALNPFFYFANVPSICDLPATALHTVLFPLLPKTQVIERQQQKWQCLVVDRDLG